MTKKAVISLTTGLEDTEKVTVALLQAVAAAESGRQTVVFLAKEAVRLAMPGVALGVACAGCPPIQDLLKRYAEAGGKYLACTLCVNAKGLSSQELISGAEPGGTVPLWQWIGDDDPITFSY